MVAELTDLGATFLSPTTDMTPAELDKRTAAADAAVKGVKAPKEIYDITVNLRKDETEAMDDHVRNALGNLEAIVDVKGDQKLRAKAIADLITGNARKKAPRKDPPASKNSSLTPTGTPTPEPDPIPETTAANHSISQQSYVKRVANLYDFITILENSPSYKPQDPTALTDYLRKYADKISALNDKVDADYKPYYKAMNLRDTLLYYPVTGVITTDVRVKRFIAKSKLPTAIKKKFVAIKFKVPSAKNLHF